MNRNRFTLSTLATYCGTVAMAFGLLFSAQSCSEKIDDGNFAIAKEQTISDYLGSKKEYSQIKSVFDRVRLGNKSNASTLAAVLSARGNYTVFAPTNDAMSAYVTKVLGESKSVADLTDEQAQLIAYSCVIDNGNESAYDSPMFPTKGGAFAKGDLNDRSITSEEVTDSLKKPAVSYYLINGTSRVVKSDTKLSNGYVHSVASVIAPSNQSVSGLIEGTANMRIMGTLLQATGWADKLNESIDRDYEKVERETDPHSIAGVQGLVPTAGHRYLGFTGFVETDDVFQKEWGVPAPVYDEKTQTVTNAQAILDAIKSHCENVYGTLAQNDLKDEDNAVNQFVAYHFMKGRVAHNQFVQHFNEWGYKYGDAKNPQQNKYSIDISDYFVSLGKYRSLIKVTQDAASHDIFLNRVAEYNVNDNYKFVRAKEEGIKVYANNDFEGKVLDNNARNGYFFPIKKIMLMDASTRESLGSERIRFDICTILPEILSNGCRSSRQHMHFPRGYFENITQESESTKFLYLHSAFVNGQGWRDYEGDELMVLGLYDFVLKLPPVPKEGQYEIRMGISNNTLRGMCQIYFGDSPVNLSPAGLPVDMRLDGDNENIGWVADNKDADITAENDKSMRNHGYMKAPKAFTACDGKGETNLRDTKAVLRRIMVSAYMYPNKTYYLRFKSALNKTDAQFFSDYFEFVPKSVYNGTVAEDIW